MTSPTVWRYDTKEEVQFTNHILPALERLNVGIPHLRHDEQAGELHVDLVLPDHSRETREAVLSLIDQFEQSYAFAISVSPTLLFVDDDTAE